MSRVADTDDYLIYGHLYYIPRDSHWTATPALIGRS